MVSEETHKLLAENEESPALTCDQTIDARIRALELASSDPAPGDAASHEQARALRSSRNAASPACCIPLEILQEIFLNIQHKPADARSPIGAPWIGFTYVCQYWRNAALGCSKIWAKITLRQGPYHEEMLERAGDAPLDVEVTQTTIRSRNLLATIKKALSYTGRLRSVTLSLNSAVPTKSVGRPIEWSWLMDPASREEASLLQELRITSLQNFPRPHNMDTSGKLLAGGAPALRILSVDMLFDFATLKALPFSSQMTHLTLWHHGKRNELSVGFGTGPSIPSLFEVLKGTPLLEELTLGIHMRPPGMDEWVQANEVTLPALRVLRIQDCGSAVVPFLKGLRLPAVAFVETGLEAPTTSDNFQQVLAQLNPSSPGPVPMPCIPRTSIRYLDISQFHSIFSVWFDALPFGHPPDSDSSDTVLGKTDVEDDKTQWYDTHTDIGSSPSRPSLRIIYPEESEIAIFNLLAKEFNIQTLRALRLVPQVSFRPAFWTETQLLWLPELKTLSVGVTELEQLIVFLRVLEGYMPQPQDDGTLVALPPGSFPSLRKVSLAGLGLAMHEIKRRRKKAERGRGVEGWDTSWDIVGAVLEAFRARPLVSMLELWTSRGPGVEELKAIEEIRAGLPGVRVSVLEQPGWYDSVKV